MLAQKLALRNLTRNKRRSAITSSIIIITFGLMIVFLGLSDGGHKAMIDIGIKMGLGHIIVYNEKYDNDPSLEHLIESSAELEKMLKGNLNNDVNMVPRLRMSVLIQSGDNGMPVTLSGVQADIESQFSKIANKDSIIKGIPLSELKAQTSNFALPKIVIGAKLANNLDVTTGDKLTVTVKPKGKKDFTREAFEIAGIFRTGMHEIDTFWVEVNLQDAQRLSSTGSAISSLSLYLGDVSETSATAALLKSSPNLSSYTIKRWDEEAPQLYSAVTLDAAGMYLLMVIIYIVVAVGILNTILISVLKRKREFGVMLAIGARPSFVVKVVFWEAVILSLFSLSIGLIVGLLGHYHFLTEGLNFKEVFGATMEAGGVLLPDRFYSSLSMTKVVFSLCFVFLLTLLVTVYPSIRSSRLPPALATK